MNNVNVDVNVEGEILNVEAINTNITTNVNPTEPYNRKKMMNNNNLTKEKDGWRRKFFSKKMCDGIIENTGGGNIEITGKLKIDKRNAKIIYWAANPPDYNVSFSGSGLPYPSPDMAFDNTKNIGSVMTKDGVFKIQMYYPNAYYVGLGSLYVPPHVHLKICEEGYDQYFSIKIGAGVPYRTLTHPAPPSMNFRSTPLFYQNDQLSVRSQENILRDSAYPEYNTIPPEIPNNFWGKRPPN
tara:strand:+ start:4438 stop:5157 length:720 start_codon:yes stop_codon:yes gene_type:complete